MILHLNTDDSRGGATRSALRLHRALLVRGEASDFFIRPKSTLPPYVDWVHDDYLNRRRTDRSGTILSFTYPGVSVAREPAVQSADLLNLHWVAGFLGAEHVGELLSLNKPLVWTFHDQWPMTGGCHYAAGCEQFTDTCRQCPQLEADEAGLIEASFRDRAATWDQRIVVVCPSQWMARQAQASRLLRNSRIEHIPYSIEHTAFSPRPKAAARQKLGLPPDAFILLFGCTGGFEKRKGMPLFRALLNQLSAAGTSNVFALFIGWQTSALSPLNGETGAVRGKEIPEKHLGFISDDDTLCDVYSAADLLVHLSSEDNLPNIPLEAMSCGTPVLGLNVGGLPEIVQHEQCGLLVPVGDIAALVKNALLMIGNPKLCHAYGAAARRAIETNFRHDLEASRYAALYHELLSSGSTPAPGVGEESVRHSTQEPIPAAASHVRNRLSDIIAFSAQLHLTHLQQEHERQLEALRGQILRLDGERRKVERQLQRAERNLGYRLVNGTRQFLRRLARRSTPPA